MIVCVLFPNLCYNKVYYKGTVPSYYMQTCESFQVYAWIQGLRP